MKLWRVTFTGADNQTSQEEMLKISQEFEFVEWGILFGSKLDRCPSQEWLAKVPQGMNLSAHLCGTFVAAAMNGNFLPLESFNRIQLNFYKKRLETALNCQPLLEAIRKLEQDVILGGNFNGVEISPDKLPPNVQILYDASGGHGVSPKNWPEPAKHTAVGYAGGLRLENLEDQLQKIEEVAKDRSVWIDMESGVRTDNRFDLDKVKQCLEICSRYI